MHIFFCNVKKKNVSATFRTLNLHEPNPASVLDYGLTTTRRVPLPYEVIYSGKQLLRLKDCMKVFKHDRLVFHISNTFCCNVKRLAGCRLTPGFCPKQPKSKSPLNFTFCTQQSHFSGGKIWECVLNLCQNVSTNVKGYMYTCRQKTTFVVHYCK
jgi:hypothetical protein